MNPIYLIENHHDLFSPALVFYKEIIRANIAEVVRLAGSAQRLCPHVKTHKTREIAQMQLEAGITSHKCATIAEAEMLAQVGTPDVIIAYPVVGPNVGRVKALAQKYPRTRFSVLVDHPEGLAGLVQGWTDMPQPLDVLLDVNVGFDRTGIKPGADAIALYEAIVKAPNLNATGLHVYDGHNHQPDLAEREAAVKALLNPVLEMRTLLEQKQLPAPRIIVGGTPTFPVWAKVNLPGLQCSPGTFSLYDSGYGSKYPELASLKPAALVVSRVISKPTPTRLTCDLGHKAIAADPPAGKRATLLNVTDYQIVLQSEEHCGIETPTANIWHIGDLIYAVPTHVCPTVALHKEAIVVEKNHVIGTWEIASRNRKITV